MDNGHGVTVSHFGSCVSDAARSMRFYIEALGFELTESVDFQEPFDVLAGAWGQDRVIMMELGKPRAIEGSCGDD